MHAGTPDHSAYTIHYTASPAGNTKDTPHVLVLDPSFGDGSEERWPQQAEDMVLLDPENEKQKIWRRTAAEVIAKDLGLWNANNQHWILDALPTGYGLFQQVTHPKPDSIAAITQGGKPKQRLDRFAFGNQTRKIRSALSLGKHLSWILFGKHGSCTCDGCKVANPRPSLAATGAEVGHSPAQQPKSGRKRKRTADYENAMAALTADLAHEEGGEDGDYFDEGQFPRQAAEQGYGSASGSGSGGASARATPVPLTSPKKKTAAAAAANGGAAVPAPAKKARTTSAGGGAAAGAKKGKGKAAAKKEEWEQDDELDALEDEEGYSGSGGEHGGAGDDSDYSEYGAGAAKVAVGARTSSGRRSKPSSKVLSGLQERDFPAEVVEEELEQAPAAAAAPTPAPQKPQDEFAASMQPCTVADLAASSTVPAEQVAQDLSFPSLSRVGELVWVRVPLGPPPQGALATAQLSRWPGIVRARTIVVSHQVGVEEQYRIELLGMSEKDTLEGVRGENVAPWVSYIPSNTAYLDEEPLPANAGMEKKRWADIQAEGWGGVADAFRRAHRTAKAYAAMQVRPIPSIKSGRHLARPSTLSTPPTSLTSLVPQPARSRYLTFPHLLLGPELLHPGDYVRLSPHLSPASDIDATLLSARTPITRTSLPTSLVMRISTFYRGGVGSPLIVRGLVFEQVELRPPPSLASRPEALWAQLPADPDSSLSILPAAVAATLPLPLPFHCWRLLRPSGASSSVASLETDVLLSSVCGRLYPLPPSSPAQRDPKTVIQWLEQADRGVHWMTKEEGKGARGGWGEEGMGALSLLAAGVQSGTGGTVRIKAVNGIAGGRNEQFKVAEEQALASIAAATKGQPTLA
ncbi:hypothetical protein JCM10213_006069 [Rhodosporidiobolus nylandii]